MQVEQRYRDVRTPGGLLSPEALRPALLAVCALALLAPATAADEAANTPAGEPGTSPAGFASGGLLFGLPQTGEPPPNASEWEAFFGRDPGGGAPPMPLPFFADPEPDDGALQEAAVGFGERKRRKKKGRRRRAPDDWPFVPDRFVLCADDGLTLPPYLTALGLQFDQVGPDLFVVMTNGVALGYEQQQASTLSLLLPGVCLVEPDLYVRPPEGSQSNSIVVGSEYGRTFDDQRAFRSIRTRAAEGRADGAGVVIAVLDTGVDPTHEVLAGRLLPGHDFIDRDDEPWEYEGGGTGLPNDSFGHGTMVAGIALGVAPAARILPVRVLDSHGQGTASGVAAGIDFAVASGADVINLSLGMRAQSLIVADRVQAALDAGVIVVVAAGNAGRRKVDFPGGLDDVLSVTAVGLRGRVAKFANGRKSASVAAPGRKVVGPYPGDTWGRANGTSFSAPLVSGVAALRLSYRPWEDATEVRDAIARHARLRVDRLLR